MSHSNTGVAVSPVSPAGRAPPDTLLSLVLSEHKVIEDLFPNSILFLFFGTTLVWGGHYFLEFLKLQVLCIALVSFNSHFDLY